MIECCDHVFECHSRLSSFLGKDDVFKVYSMDEAAIFRAIKRNFPSPDVKIVCLIQKERTTAHSEAWLQGCVDALRPAGIPVKEDTIVRTRPQPI